MDASLTDFGNKHRAKPVRPKTNRFILDIDLTLEQQVLDLAQRSMISNTNHRRQGNGINGSGSHLG